MLRKAHKLQKIKMCQILSYFETNCEVFPTENWKNFQGSLLLKLETFNKKKAESQFLRQPVNRFARKIWLKSRKIQRIYGNI